MLIIVQYLHTHLMIASASDEYPIYRSYPSHSILQFSYQVKMLAAWLKRQDSVLKVGVPSWSVLQTALREIGENELKLANQ